MTPEEHYEKVCKPVHTVLKDGQKAILEEQKKTNKRLFESNGDEALVVTVKNLKDTQDILKTKVEGTTVKPKMKIGNVELSGFEARDLFRMAIVIFVLYAWLEHKNMLPEFLSVEKAVVENVDTKAKEGA
jgi:hypothetical protein